MSSSVSRGFLRRGDGGVSGEPFGATGVVGFPAFLRRWRDVLNGTIGSGGCQLQLTDSNGSIEIAKAP